MVNRNSLVYRIEGTKLVIAMAPRTEVFNKNCLGYRIEGTKQHISHLENIRMSFGKNKDAVATS